MAQMFDPTLKPRVDRPASSVADHMRSAVVAGRTRPFLWRKEQLLRLRRVLVQHTSVLCECLAADFGTCLAEPWRGEIRAAVQACDRALADLRTWTAPRRVGSRYDFWAPRTELVAEPAGVVLVLAGWPEPVRSLLMPLAGALTAGSAVVLHPARESARTSELLARLLSRALDPQAVRVEMGGPGATAELLEQRFDHVWYSGGVAAGREVARLAAGSGASVTLALTPRSVCLVGGSARLRSAARRIAWSKFRHAGQRLLAPDFVVVESAIEPAFLRSLGLAVRELFGPDPRTSPDFGRIVDAATHSRLCERLNDHEIYQGGIVDPASRYVSPTIVRCDSNGAALKLPFFGPILPVVSVDSDDAALRLALDVTQDVPLALCLFADDPRAREHVLSYAAPASVSINGAPPDPFASGRGSAPGASTRFLFATGARAVGASGARACFEHFSRERSMSVHSPWIDVALSLLPPGRLRSMFLRRLS